MQGREAAHFYEARQQEAMQLIASYDQLHGYIQQQVDAVAGQLEAARLELAQAYLPRLDREHIARLPEATGFLGFDRRDPLAAMDHERVVLENTIKRITADERYQNREILAGPDGTLTTKLVEIDEMLAPWQAECHTYEQHEGFLELIQVKYDTPEFDAHWWQGAYWKHWAAGDRICKALDVGDFGDDILPVYTKAAEQRAFWQNERNGITTQIAAVHKLVQDHDNAVARIPQLPALYLAQCQDYLGQYLEQADAALLDSWLPREERPTLFALRKLAGLNAKKSYLLELRDQGIKKEIDGLRQRAGKFARKTQKYLRSKHYYRSIPDRELDYGFQKKYGNYAQRPGKLQRLVDRVVAYDDYSTFDLSNDPALWWFEFTGKKPPTHLPKTRRWYDRRTSFQIQREPIGTHKPDVDTAVALAAASRELDEVGYLS